MTVLLEVLQYCIQHHLCSSQRTNTSLPVHNLLAGHCYLVLDVEQQQLRHYNHAQAIVLHCNFPFNSLRQGARRPGRAIFLFSNCVGTVTMALIIWNRNAMLAVSLIPGILVCPHTHTSWFFCQIR